MWTSTLSSWPLPPIFPRIYGHPSSFASAMRRSSSSTMAPSMASSRHSASCSPPTKLRPRPSLRVSAAQAAAWSWQHGRRMGLWQNFSGSNAHSDAPPPRSSPLAWGNPPYVKQLLGDSFELEFEHGVSHTYHGGVEDIRQWYTRGLGTVASARREPSSGPRATAQARRRCLSSALRCSSRAAREA